MKMDDLDEKLDVEFEKAWGRALDASMDDDFKNEDGSLNEAEYLSYQENARKSHAEDIKQAFIDAGYVGPYLEPKDTAGRYRTGQEWYDRFEKELGDYDFLDEDATKVIAAAKKAAGIE